MYARPFLTFLMLTLIATLLCVPAAAQDDPPAADDNADAPAAPAVEGRELTITVTAIKGARKVQVRQAEDQPWQWPQVGMTLKVGAEVRTGFGGAIQLRIEPGHTITIDRASTVKVLQAIRAEDGVVHTDIGMPKGRTRYDIEEVGAGHNARVHTPGTSMAIRGTTTISQSDAISGSIHRTLDNVVSVVARQARQQVQVAAGIVTDKQLQPAAVRQEGQRNSRNTAFDGNDDIGTQLTTQYPDGTQQDAQNGLLAQHALSRNQNIGVPSAEIGVFGDTLVIDIFWLTDFFGPGDVDLNSTDPFSATVFAKAGDGPTIVRMGEPTQGFHNGDDTGDFGFGLESVTYGPEVAEGDYNVAIRHRSGDSASGTVTATLGVTQIFSQPFSVGSGSTANFTVPVAQPD